MNEEFKKILQEKNNEIVALKNKLSIFLKKIKFLENKIYMKSFNEDNKNNNQCFIDRNNELIKTKTSRVFSAANEILSKNKNKSLNIIPHSRTKKKKFLMKSLSSSILNNQSNINNDTFIVKHIDNSSIGESVNNFIFNINESISNKGTLDSLLINLGSNQTINSEKIKVQKKLDEYRKLIDKKLNELISTRRNHINTNKMKTSSIRLKLFNNEGKNIIYNSTSETVFNQIGKKIKCISNRSQININTHKFKIA